MISCWIQIHFEFEDVLILFLFVCQWYSRLQECDLFVNLNIDSSKVQITINANISPIYTNEIN